MKTKEETVNEMQEELDNKIYHSKVQNKEDHITTFEQLRERRFKITIDYLLNKIVDLQYQINELKSSHNYRVFYDPSSIK